MVAGKGRGSGPWGLFVGGEVPGTERAWGTKGHKATPKRPSDATHALAGCIQVGAERARGWRAEARVWGGKGRCEAKP